ncbi:MAG: D-alanyl-D-alanine carboxypeptidase/D-alanyl-D-alanine-endopeptidase [Chlorobiaceae bacterium]|nr:D-alanyl-D-alanine carboxypeptidase/D-alanyl-D-alanine-endopeptidase [Chlorobiaceae bacterium]MBA4310090.1 D-alanyl-D-alanine carboxypeptidase/D-alanyl-D-alanine-endopeptidase [Chlorobiaceae bacterium]
MINYFSAGFYFKYRKDVMNIFFYIFIFFYLFGNSAQSQNFSLNEKLDSLFSSPFFDTAQVSLTVYDLSENKNLYEINSLLLMSPASNMKILTSAAALLFLGKDYYFTTSFYYSGEIRDSVLNGDLYIQGGCDPDFSLTDFEKVIDTLKYLGIKKIAGNIFGDISFKDSLFWGNGWMWDDDPSTDAPYFSPLNINDNAVQVNVKTTEENKLTEVVLAPESNYFSLTNLSTTKLNEKNNFVVTRDFLNRTNEIIVKGNFSRNYSTRLNVFAPEKYFLTLFEEKLNNKNIEFEGKLLFDTIPNQSQLLYQIKRNYLNVLPNLNKYSDNLSTEMVLYAMAEKYFGQPATAENGIKLIDSMITLSGLQPASYRIVDGSGVSHYNLISTELLLKILKYFYYNHSDLYVILKNSFPIAGVDGTLKNRMRNNSTLNNVYAKTGTLSGVSSLSGYLNSSSGNYIAFSIMIQNYVGRSINATKYIDEVCKILAEY